MSINEITQPIGAAADTTPQLNLVTEAPPAPAAKQPCKRQNAKAERTVTPTEPKPLESQRANRNAKAQRSLEIAVEDAESDHTAPASRKRASTDAKHATAGKRSPKTAGKNQPVERCAANPGARRDGSKTELVLKKLRLSKGASIAQLVEATGWQAHSVRGFLSAAVKKKLGLQLVSEIGKDGVRRYRIADSAAG